MRTGSELIRATKPFAREVRWRSWWYFWSTLAVLAGLLALTTLDVYWLWRLLVSILAGLTVVRMFAIYHDFEHGAILRGSALAGGLLRVYGMLILTPPSIWRHSHQYHHHHHARLQAAGIGSFRVMTTKAFARATPFKRLVYAIGRHPLTILAGYATVFLYGMCLYPALTRPRQHLDAALALVLHVTLVTVLAPFRPGPTAVDIALAANRGDRAGVASVLRATQFSHGALPPAGWVGLHFRRLGRVELHSHEPGVALVHRQHWLPPRPPS